MFYSAAVKNNSNIPGIDTWHTCVHCILKILQVAVIDNFLTSTFTNTNFQFPGYLQQSLKNKHTHI